MIACETPIGCENQARPDIARRVAQGRGQGEGGSYKPWLNVREVASRGKSSRILGWKTKRVHTVLSGLEEHYFYSLEWGLSVIDIREQFPLLPLRDTIAVAESLGVAHPAYPRSRPIVVTVDFLLTVRLPRGVLAYHARSVKKKADLKDRRVREKLAVERVCCEARGWDWGYVTEEEIPWILAENVRYLHPRRDPAFGRLDPATVRAVREVLNPLVPGSQRPLCRLCSDCDELLGLPGGRSLAVARHLLATRRWEADMDQPIDPGRPLRLLGIHDDEILHQRAA